MLFRSDAIGRVLKEACKGQYQMSLFAGSEESQEESQATFHEKHEIMFDEELVSLDERVTARINWIAQGNVTQCPGCHAEFLPESYGNPACKNGPVCLSCGWSHCG